MPIGQGPKPQDTVLKPHLALPKPPPAVPFDDRLLMAVGVLGFGTAIPLLAHLYGEASPSQLRFWLGYAWFVGLAAAIWGGNRWLLFKQREHFDWFANPWRKLVLLVSATVLYTAPLTAAWLATWYAANGLPVDARAIELVVLTNVICVLFVTHAYETVFLIRERESDLMQVERLERSRAEAELSALKAQVDPHFLFNSLNTLGHLVAHDPKRAREFCDTLAEVYRYVLASRSRNLVPLKEELEFVSAYARLLSLRFAEAMQLVLEPSLHASMACEVPPLALQTLLENAAKHNQLGEGAPLVVRMGFDNGSVVVHNELRPRSSLRPGEGVGLRNLDERCRLLTGRGLALRSEGGRFEARVPVLPEVTA